MYGATKVGKRAAAVPAIKHEKNSIIHQVQQNDTLLGIAVKYGVSVLEIKRENKLWKDEDISAHKTLVIPKDAEKHRKEEMEQEQQRQHCLEGFLRHTESQDTEEALRYLEASCWNVNKAIQAFDRDTEKEENRRKFIESHPNWLPTPGTQVDQTDSVSVAARVRARGGMGFDNRDGTKLPSETVKKEPENFAEALWNTIVDIKETFTFDRIILG